MRRKKAAEKLAKQRKLLRFGNKATEFNQWDLVMTGISIVNQTTHEMWKNSFTRVNLHLLTCIKLSDCTEKIKGYLIAVYFFKNFNSKPIALEKFSFFPQFWWGVSPKEI